MTILPHACSYLKTSLFTCICIILFALPAFGSVSFDIPEDHEALPFLDSLYTQIVKLDKIVKQKEKRYLTDPLVLRQKKFAAKEEYYDMLVEAQSIKQTTLVAFYKQLKRYYETRMIYFEKLLSILKGDDRVPCFALYRQARDNYGAIQQTILKHTPQEFNLGDE
jgi:hypothetical protein